MIFAPAYPQAPGDLSDEPSIRGAQPAVGR